MSTHTLRLTTTIAALITTLVGCTETPSVMGTADAASMDSGPRLDGALDANSPLADTGNIGGDVAACADRDGDGARDLACGGTDCDDNDSARYPNNTELCDAVDNDCDPSTLGPDRDRDTFPQLECCNPDDVSGAPVCGTDCDDNTPDVSPTAPEVCNRLDDDCDGMRDEGVDTEYFRDVDGDGFGVVAGSVRGCSPPGAAGWALSSTDCDDMNMAVHPGVPEICDNGVDNDCDGSADIGPGLDCQCVPGTNQSCGTSDGMGGFLSQGICRVGTQACVAGRWTECAGAVGPEPGGETCNGLDDDCDGTVDDGVSVVCYGDSDEDTYASAGTTAMPRCPDPTRMMVGGCPLNFTDRAPTDQSSIDCADGTNTRNPGTTEICNEVDDDCDLMVNEGTDVPCYIDADSDGYAANTAVLSRQCPDEFRSHLGRCPAGYTNRMPLMGTTDCNDTQGVVSPIAAEVCNNRDDDCDTRSDEGTTTTYYADGDGDGYAPMGASTRTFCSGTSNPGYTTRAPGMGTTDCVDNNDMIRPGLTEVCDAMMVDENCNTMRNEGCTCSGTETRSCGAAVPPALGRCAMGVQTCNGGRFGACSIDPQAAVCDEPGFTDEDCDGRNDVAQGLTVTCYPDTDRDGYAARMVSSVPKCPDPMRMAFGGCPEGFTNRVPCNTADCYSATTDCAEGSDTINPAGTEACNGMDDDCDMVIDDITASNYCAMGSSPRVCDDASCTASGSDGRQYCDSCQWSACIAETGGPRTRECLPGSARACSVGGCGNIGTQYCSAACSFGGQVCNPPGSETNCDYADSDCDGRVDEGIATTCSGDWRPYSGTNWFGGPTWTAGYGNGSFALGGREIAFGNSQGAAYITQQSVSISNSVTIQARFAVANTGGNGPNRVAVYVNRAPSGPNFDFLDPNYTCTPSLFNGLAFVVNYDASRIEIWQATSDSFFGTAPIATRGCLDSGCGRGSGGVVHHYLRIVLTNRSSASFELTSGAGYQGGVTSAIVLSQAQYNLGAGGCGLVQSLPSAQANLFEFTVTRSSACQCRPW